MGYAISKTGGFRAVNDKSWCTPDEKYSETQPENVVDEQSAINAEARAYLSKTDWYIVRLAETGEPVPDEILKSRKEARGSVK